MVGWAAPRRRRSVPLIGTRPGGAATDMRGAMSFHYEVVFSLFLRDDIPSGVLDELRWHLGLSTQQPDACAIDYDWPQMRPDERSYLPGGEVAVLRRQYRYSQSGVQHHAWGLYARLFWLDDRWAEAWWQVAAWLAPYADGD